MDLREDIEENRALGWIPLAQAVHRANLSGAVFLFTLDTHKLLSKMIPLCLNIMK